jgi:hypothetical protein
MPRRSAAGLAFAEGWAGGRGLNEKAPHEWQGFGFCVTGFKRHALSAYVEFS